MNDPKFIWLAQKAKTNVASVIAVWAALLEHASQEDERGCVGGFDPESYDCALGLEDGTCFRVMEAMETKGLLSGGRVANWESRQPKNDDNSTDRVRAYRQRQRNETVCNGHETVGNTDKSRLEERREEKKEEGAKAPRASRRAPTDFEPDRLYALREVPDMDVEREVQKFRDCQFKRAHSDWSATWRNWIATCRDGGKYARKGGRPTTRFEENQARLKASLAATEDAPTNPLLEGLKL